MSSWLHIDEEAMELACAISERLGSTNPRVIKMALALLAIDLGLKFQLPRKEKEDAG